MSYSSVKMSEWITFTPDTNLTDLASIAGQYRRHGTNMEMAVRIQIGASTSMAGGVWIGLPTGFTTGASYVPGLGGDFIADVMFQDITVGRYRGSALVLISWETPHKIILHSIGANGLAGGINATNPFIWAVSDIINLHVAYLPIAEWGG